MAHSDTLSHPRSCWANTPLWVCKAFSFPALLGTSLAAVSFVLAGYKLADPDTWWHISVGRQILSSRSWPTADAYSHTAGGTHWIAYEWLGEVLMALVAPGGLQALLALLAVLAATLMVLLYWYAYLRSGNAKAAFVACALVLPIAAAFFTLRPQLLGYILLLITFICLEAFRQGHSKALWVLPALFVIWVNTHGTFAFGLFTVGLYWVSGLVRFQWGGIQAEPWTPAQRKRILLILLLCMLALTITPYGTQLAAYPLQMAFSQPVNIANIMEWQSIGVAGGGLKLFLALLLPFIVAQAALRPAYRLHEFALLVFAIYAACVHLRFLILFAAVFAPIAALLLARWMPAYNPGKDRRVFNATIMLVIAAAVVKYFPSNEQVEALVAEKYPHRAVQYLQEQPVSGSMLNEYGWGGYLIWKMAPAHKVFIDGRADIYEHTGVLSDYLRIMRLDPETLLLLQKYGVQACLIKRETPLATLLAALPEWQRAYHDDVSVLYVRRNGLSRPTALVADNASPGRDAPLSVPGAAGSGSQFK